MDQRLDPPANHLGIHHVDWVAGGEIGEMKIMNALKPLLRKAAASAIPVG